MARIPLPLGSLLVALLAAAPLPLAAQVSSHDRVAEAVEVVETWLEAQRAYDQVPSISAAIVHDQELVWSGAVGMAHPERGIEATPETLYSICSISKLFTAVAAMQLRDAGLFELRDPVSEHLPWFDVRQRHDASAPVTIEGILTHSAGLPRESNHPYWTGPDFPFPTREEIIDGLSQQETLYPAWRTFQYSNLGLTLAGELISELTGTRYADFIQDRILTPLGMGNTYSDIPAEHRGDRLATGYGSLTRDGDRREVAFFQARGIAPAAGFASTPEDLARFASWQFRLLADGRRNEVLSGHTLAQMHRVHYVDPEWETHWGLGFSVLRDEGKTFVGHGGSCPGFRSQFILQPDEKVAVVAMANAMVNAGTYARGAYALVAGAIGEAAAGNDDGVAEDDDGGQGPGEAGGAAGATDGPDLTPYMGTYDQQPWSGETAAVRWKGGLALLSLPTENPLRALTELRHEEGDVFVRVRSDGEDGEAITFERDEEGSVVGFRRHGQFSPRIR
jgi:CubicO group peptidase (beta-lactamase class C family)